MKVLLFVISAFSLAGCEVAEYGRDQELNRELFKECMQALPKGPNSTVYNDWAEVVDECKGYAYHGSRVCVSGCGSIK